MRPVAKPGAAAAGTDAGTHQHTQPLIHRQAVATPARGSATELSAASAGASGGGAGGLTFVTFGNTAMWDFTHNWVLAVQLLRRPFVVGALDRGMSERCAAEGFPHVDLWREEVRRGRWRWAAAGACTESASHACGSRASSAGGVGRGACCLLPQGLIPMPLVAPSCAGHDRRAWQRPSSQLLLLPRRLYNLQARLLAAVWTAQAACPPAG